jgi:hypothetical protein
MTIALLVLVFTVVAVSLSEAAVCQWNRGAEAIGETNSPYPIPCFAYVLIVNDGAQSVYVSFDGTPAVADPDVSLRIEAGESYATAEPLNRVDLICAAAETTSVRLHALRVVR